MPEPPHPLPPGDFCKIQPGSRMIGRILSALRFNEGWIPAFAGMTDPFWPSFDL